MNTLVRDCHHALRIYFRSPGGSLLAIAALTIAAAVFGAFLSLYVDLALKPHPGFEQSDRFASIGLTNGEITPGIPYEIVERMTGEMASIEAAVVSYSLSVSLGAEQEDAEAELVSSQFSSELRPKLAMGRAFRSEDHSPEAVPVVVISYRLWQERFGGREDVVGITIPVSRSAMMDRVARQSGGDAEVIEFRIVGVMAKELRGLFRRGTPLWMPLEQAYPILGPGDNLARSIGGRTYVRRRPGVSIEAVEREFDARYAGQLDPLPGVRTIVVDGLFTLHENQLAVTRQLGLFLAAGVLLALVAAMNVSLFLLARAPGRRRELGIRMAVGAPFARLVRQLVTEAGLIVVISTALGLLLSIWLRAYLNGLAFTRNAEWRDVTFFDWRVLALTAVFLLIVVSVVSLVPALDLRRIRIAASTRENSARASPSQFLVGTAQVAVAGTLGGAAIAFASYLAVLVFGYPGYETADLYVVDGPARVNELFRSDQTAIELARRRNVLEAIPGVSAVAFGFPVPRDTFGNRGSVQLPAPQDPASQITVRTGAFERRFIELLGLRLLHGRTPEDGETARVAVVNQALGRALWGRENVVGERLPGTNYWGPAGVEIIGVIEDLSFDHPAAAVQPQVFLTLNNVSAFMLTTLVKAQLTATELQQTFDAGTADGSFEFRVSDVRPLSEAQYQITADDRARGLLTIVASAVVVALAAFGYYGTQHYLVAAGRREYAIRAALGCGPRALGRLVIRRGLMLSLPGLALGAPLAFTVVAWLRDDYLSRDVSPGVVTLCAIAGLVLLLISASLGPAHEARRTQPATLLRDS